MNTELPTSTLPALYFDGQVVKGTPVNVYNHEGQLEFFIDDVRHAIALGDIQRPESFGNAPVVVELPNGALLEFDRKICTPTLKRWNVLSLSWFEKLQYHPAQWLLVSLAAVFVTAGVYMQGLPLLSKWIAFEMQHDTVSELVGDVLPELDGRIFTPSKLDEQTKAKHQQQLDSLMAGKAEFAHVKLAFRSSEIGPNAFALPDGTIVLTDELLKALPPETIPGVLAHELGHIDRRHMTRRLLQHAIVGTLIAAFSGDVSFLAGTLAAEIAGQHYSREFELEADLFAIELFLEQRRDLATLELLHEKLGSLGGGAREKAGYLDSHPAAAERIQLIRDKLQTIHESSRFRRQWLNG